MTDDRLPLHSAHTHLFRGARLTAATAPTELGASPRGVRIAFSDGVEVDAELLRNDAGDLALDLPRYRTRAGTEIPAKAWSATVADDGAGSALVVGHSL